jgi:hypothetical protein
MESMTKVLGNQCKGLTLNFQSSSRVQAAFPDESVTHCSTHYRADLYNPKELPQQERRK